MVTRPFEEKKRILSDEAVRYILCSAINPRLDAASLKAGDDIFLSGIPMAKRERERKRLDSIRNSIKATVLGNGVTLEGIYNGLTNFPDSEMKEMLIELSAHAIKFREQNSAVINAFMEMVEKLRKAQLEEPKQG